ncbi:MAG: hypothetical protein U0S50_16390 [Sphingopyxis sp.]|uniref:hypothetical protein n=1 Tax=Sphingopyxis sp. TaxID=1908224 RepID=UPI002AB7F63D|nr:hypothetical protein [Sphingopyxis sp.]MDZ3833372.1 hypothetical protein [Sphingopyxis sp.]
MAMYKSPATKRYVVRLVVLMTAYLVALPVTNWLFKNGNMSGALAYALAVLPALPIIGVFWAVMRLLVEEPDEFIRMLLVRQCLVATGFCLTVMTIWQFLQNFHLLPFGDGGFGAAFFWFLGLGVGALYNKLTVGTAGSCW